MDAVKRKSFTGENKIYFWTATIHSWYDLLTDDVNKQIICNSLQTLSERKLISVYGFVIMPTHIHLIWQLHEKNGKESAKGSFMKFTAHEFKKKLQGNKALDKFKVNASNKQYEFWQRDSLGIEIYSKSVAIQKLGYMHFNPVKGKWKLAFDDLSYFYSSARFYETGLDDFGFLKNIFELFDG